MKELGPFLLKKPATWFPVAAVVYADVARTLGETSAIFKALIRDFMAITQPCQIHVDLPLVHLRIAGVVADMDAQRAIFASKGSAGWKPCLFCSNKLFFFALCCLGKIPGGTPFSQLHKSGNGSRVDRP